MLLLHGEHDFIAGAPGLEHKSGTCTSWCEIPCKTEVPLEHAQRHYDAAVHSSQRELVVLDADHNTLAGAAQLGCRLAAGHSLFVGAATILLPEVPDFWKKQMAFAKCLVHKKANANQKVHS